MNSKTILNVFNWPLKAGDARGGDSKVDRIRNLEIISATCFLFALLLLTASVPPFSAICVTFSRQLPDPAGFQDRAARCSIPRGTANR